MGGEDSKYCKTFQRRRYVNIVKLFSGGRRRYVNIVKLFSGGRRRYVNIVKLFRGVGEDM